MPRPSPDHPVLRAAARWRERCLRNDGSVFTEKSLWTAENVGYLVQYFAENLDEGEGSFLEKLEQQLSPAPGSAKQLAAEMLWVMYLPLIRRAMHAATRRRQIRTVWEWSGERLPEAPLELEEALNEGLLHPGTAYNTLRWREFLFLVRAVEAWKGLGEMEREARLTDPWLFSEWLLDLDDSQNRQLRHILCYFLFPEHFEPVATNDHKRMIVRAFRIKYGRDPEQVDYLDRLEMDRQIGWVRERIVEEGSHQGLSLYDEPLRSIWQPSDGNGKGGAANADAWYAQRFGKTRVWVMSAGQNARWWDDFVRMNVIAIGWDDVGDLRELSTRESIHEMLRDVYGRPNPTNDSLACWQFAHEMQHGDHVIVKKGRSALLGYGRITSEYEFHAMRPEFKHVRHVQWENTGTWPLPSDRWLAPKTLTDSSKYHNWLQFALGLIEANGNDRNDPDVNGTGGDDHEPYTLEEALSGLFLDRSRFHEIMDTFERKMNIVLEGPPGVGKTFIAKRLAYRLIGYKVPERVRMIQFHQSYAYEDFIQGYRPHDDGGFELRNGVFYTFCRQAAADPDKRYVFIIDEVNRGNLTKIFGEIMMLIEPDKRESEYAVPLTYSPDDEPFFVPDNVFLIGMMNTADRSLAMVDYALRRRFAFIRLEPAFGTDQFSDHLLEAGVEEDLVDRIVDRLSTLNKGIRDERKNLGPGFEIGHSFFCPREADEQLDEPWYEAIVRREIEPLLREYWFDRPEHADKLTKQLLA
ncbi:AAA family ATPase [Candidatus Palauibacter sp.]|uniref:AAA family ATPase n=1 Tax=Candidatus Palauibacter sp. TaxID=3101350 RepID=UPI003B01D054